MTDVSFKYDIAFSFTSEDEALATDLNDLLQDQFSTFLYSKKQEVVAGTDGEQSFGAVFGKDARFILILYRAKWGTTPWTRIEETAIRNRAFEEGYDFTLFIPLEQRPALPTWIPKNRLFIGLDRWGLKGAASVIETRVRDAGGSPRVESTLDHALRLKRRSEFEAERKRFLGSHDGVNAATTEAERLVRDLSAKAQEIKEKADLPLSVEQDRLWIDLCAGQGCLALTWHPGFSNTLDESYLDVGFWVGTPRRPGRYFRGHEPRKVQQERFLFDMGPGKALGWSTTNGDFVPVDGMVDRMLRLLLDLTQKRQTEGRK